MMNHSQMALVKLLARQAVGQHLTQKTPQPCGFPSDRSNRPVQIEPVKR